VSSPGDDTIIVRALPESSLLECSSPEGCGSTSDSESELSRARIWECLIRGAMSAASAA
jgi:hypothetical protein